MDVIAPELGSFALDVHRRRLEEMLGRAELSVELGDWSEGRRRFALFRGELDVHFLVEEELLYPAFEAVLGGGGYGDRLRAAHRELALLADRIEVLLRDELPVSEAIARFGDSFEAHKREEERLVYPAFDRTASPSTRAAILAELESLLHQAYEPRSGFESRQARRYSH